MLALYVVKFLKKIKENFAERTRAKSWGNSDVFTSLYQYYRWHSFIKAITGNIADPGSWNRHAQQVLDVWSKKSAGSSGGPRDLHPPCPDCPRRNTTCFRVLLFCFLSRETTDPVKNIWFVSTTNGITRIWPTEIIVRPKNPLRESQCNFRLPSVFNVLCPLY